VTTSCWRPAAVFLGVMLAFGCGGDGSQAVDTQTLRRYCELAQQLDQTAAGAGAAPSLGTFGGSSEAVGRLVAQMGPTLNEMRASAPKDLRRSVTTLVDALEAAKDGEVAALAAAEVTEATGKINAFRARWCSTAATSGEG
jgi:hypothetical protein